jgi:hypothetical protein
MGARNRVGIGLSYQPTMLHRLAELIPGLLKSLQIRALVEESCDDESGITGVAINERGKGFWYRKTHTKPPLEMFCFQETDPVIY